MSRGSAAVVAVWALLNVALTVMLLIYGGSSLNQRWGLYAGAIALTAVSALLVLVVPSGRRNRPSSAPASGAPALAIAGAAFAGGLAWVFGVYLAYLAVPLLVYAGFKIRADSGPRGERR